MPLVHRILVTLRTLMEDEPQPSNNKKRRSNPGGRNNNRSRQTTAIILTFRDLFRSGGLDIILDEMDSNRRPNRRCNGRNSSAHNRRNDCASKAILCTTDQPRCNLDSQVAIGNQKLSILTTYKPNYEDETVPLLLEESTVVSCRDLVVSPNPFIPRVLFGDGSLPSIRNKKQKTVPLNPEDENKTVETLRKVLKWSPRKQQSAAFAVTLPVEDEHVALAVVENAVNRVKEEQLTKKKKRKFLWLKFC